MCNTNVYSFTPEFRTNLDTSHRAQWCWHLEVPLYISQRIDCHASFLPAEQKHMHTICKCLDGLQRDDIIGLGLSLGLYYPSLVKMQMLPHDMVHAWLLRMDNVPKQSGTPTTETLIQALESQGLSGHAEKVKSSFIIT